MTDQLTFHEGFSDARFDAEYNLRLSRPDYEATVVPRWTSGSENACATLSNRLDIRYGPGPKQCLDVFSCGDPGAPTLIYIHGGYWHRGDKSIYSFIATPYVEAGVNVVIIGYDLCPDVTITEISAQLRQGMAYVYENASELGLNGARIVVMGHSAGGHLTQMMMGTDWAAYQPGLPGDLVRAGIPVSPLSLLDPVRRTAALNTHIRMSEQEAEAESPMLNHHPRPSAPLMVVVGGAETPEFHRQAQMYVDAFSTDVRQIDLCVIPGADHFDELTALTDPGSDVFSRVSAILSAT